MGGEQATGVPGPPGRGARGTGLARAAVMRSSIPVSNGPARRGQRRRGLEAVRRGLEASLLLLVASWAAACRTTALQPTEVSAEAVLLTIPMVQQDELYECGLASMSALSAYYGRTVSPEQRAALVAVASREEGLSGAELRTALEAAGFEVFIFPGTLDHGISGLYGHVDQGRPLLVMISADGETHHYCLFTGYDPEHDNVFLLDPRRGNGVLPSSHFAALWSKAGSFTLLAVPATQASPPTTLSP